MENNKTAIVGNAETSVEEVSSLKEQLSILIAKNKELTDELVKKEQLFKIIAHDLRGPIVTVTDLIRILSEDIDSMNKEDMANILKMILQSSEATSKLLEDLLKWRHSGIKMEIMNINLSNQVKDAIASLLLMAEKKNISIKNEISDEIDVKADSNMLQIVIRNLSSNAIKFTEPEGNISISCEKKDDLVKIYVTDNGIGIPKNKQDKILNNLGDTTLGTNGEKGTGLGLSICEEMVHKMGGTLGVMSKGEGQGTTFTITLPAGNR